MRERAVPSPVGIGRCPLKDSLLETKSNCVSQDNVFWRSVVKFSVCSRTRFVSARALLESEDQMRIGELYDFLGTQSVFSKRKCFIKIPVPTCEQTYIGNGMFTIL